MRVIGFNGSPRKKWNTASLVGRALEGAASAGAETELVHLYDLTYQGCISCFSCKKVGGPSYGRCAVKDQLRPILDRVHQADALILGTPVYLQSATGAMRSFIERLVFPYLVYELSRPTLYPKRINVVMIYTMNITREQAEQIGLDWHFNITQGYMERIFGPCETMLATDTLQFNDYSKYHAPVFDAEAKAKRRREIFPKELQLAFDLGAAAARPVEAGEGK